MTLVTLEPVNPDEEITADSANRQPAAIAQVVNGNLDDTNISSVSGTKVANGTLTDVKMDYPRWYQEIGRTTVASTTDTLSVTGLPARKYLKLLIYLVASGVVDTTLRFNTDSASNYSFTSSIFDGNGYGTSTSQSGILLEHNPLSNGNIAAYSIEVIPNMATGAKLVMIDSMYTAPSATAFPVPTKVWGQWANTTALISSIQVINAGAGDLGIGSEMIVLGHD